MKFGDIIDDAICTSCGKRGKVTIVTDVDLVCDDCLDEDYRQCDCCNYYYLWMWTKFYNLKDGRAICEYCYDEKPEDFGEVESIEE